MNKKIKDKELKNCNCENDSYFYRSNEHFRTNLEDVEFSKDFNHEDYEGTIKDDQFYMDKSDNFSLEYDYNRSFIGNPVEFPNEYNKDSIYEYDKKNNKGHEWGNEQK